MARMCSGVVPQQPPVMLSQPASAHSRMRAAVSAGSSSYSAMALGSPAFGCAETSVSAMRASSSTCGRSCFAPSAQLKPIESGRAWRTEFQNASGVWPDSVRPEASVIVPEIMTGRRSPHSSKNSSMAKSAAFAFSVSKIVSTRRMSTPPSTSARVGLQVGVLHLVEVHGTEARVVHVGREGERAVHRARARRPRSGACPGPSR